MGSGSGWLYEGVYESEVARVKSNVFNMRTRKRLPAEHIHPKQKKNIH